MILTAMSWNKDNTSSDKLIITLKWFNKRYQKRSNNSKCPSNLFLKIYSNNSWPFKVAISSESIPQLKRTKNSLNKN